MYKPHESPDIETILSSVINDFLTPEGRSAAWEAYHSNIPTIVDELAMQARNPNTYPYSKVIFKVVHHYQKKVAHNQKKYGKMHASSCQFGGGLSSRQLGVLIRLIAIEFEREGALMQSAQFHSGPDDRKRDDAYEYFFAVLKSKREAEIGGCQFHLTYR